MPVTVNNSQWLGDIALQACGSIEALFALAAANGMSVTDDVPNGREVVTVAVIDSRLRLWYANNGVIPATALSSDEWGGIGMWAIEMNFKVS
jgi:hypothetical protein